MMTHPGAKTLTRRSFAAALTAAGTAAPLLAQETTPPVPKHPGPPPETPQFGGALEFTRKDAPVKVVAFAMTDVQLLPGPFHRAQQANLGYLRRLDADRLLYNFRVNAGLPSSAQPLGGWEKPDCELRGHFIGHFLSACALMYSSTGDNDIKAKGDSMVAELAKCQHKLGAGGYLSAFPLELFDRLDTRKKVWAPFYTIHKIMAGMLDMSQHCGNRQALEVLQGMANWAGKWTADKSEPHMQDILNTEYGGMNEVLYNLAAVTGDNRYAQAGDRFTKKRFFNPLAAHRDELRGLHVNTHIPQVIGAARRYEISNDERFHDVADFFWYEVTGARSYVTGGTSNNEGWLVEPRRLAAELKQGVDTTECCCAYNMLKLTRRLYGWTADPRYFDYYERTLYNHRLSAIEASTGHTEYYLPIAPGSWKTFNTDDDSFWCCTGTGVEEFSKLNDSIYFYDHADDAGLYVNLFIPSELHWREKGIRIRQENKFPDTPATTLEVTLSQPVHMPLRLRIPYWATSGASVKINGRPVEATASPGSYLTLTRTWETGDRVELELPMSLHIEKMPDDPSMQAVLYGPLVLAGDLGSEGLSPDLITGPEGPAIREHPIAVPAFRAASDSPDSWIKPAGEPLTFRTSGQQRDVTLAPFDRTFGRRYSIYWNVS
jgi:DUF1680 family protein